MRASKLAFLGTLALMATVATACQASTEASEARADTRQASATPPVLQEDTVLQAAIASTTRPATDVARDRYRHPYETLTFWGLTPGQTVVEISPGRGGWWTAILQPYAAATGGRYVPVSNPVESMVVEDGTADMVLVARAFHNWHRAGRTEPFMQAFFKALKPGGVLAVEQHRAAEGLNPDQTAPTGYVSESHVIKAAEAAGFVLDARSELNANPRDDRDHPFGVWTLPPVRTSAPAQGATTGRTTPLTEAERAEYDAIGESDRMTLRFRKPA
ncbi:MAG: methyltransferase [Caulobacteraceae bacterium]|nr:methyltransferase [Caulobacteraceae bacterium]